MVIEYFIVNYGIWDIGLLPTVVSRTLLIWSVFLVWFIQVSLKSKMTQSPKQGVKIDPGLPLLFFRAVPTKMPLQYYKLALAIEKYHIKHMYLHFSLKDLLDI